MQFPHKPNKKIFVDKLLERKANANCTVCQANDWTIPDEAGILRQWSNIIPGPGMPVLPMVCNNCGYVRMHALGALDMMPEEAQAKPKETDTPSAATAGQKGGNNA